MALWAPTRSHKSCPSTPGSTPTAHQRPPHLGNIRLGQPQRPNLRRRRGRVLAPRRAAGLLRWRCGRGARQQLHKRRVGGGIRVCAPERQILWWEEGVQAKREGGSGAKGRDSDGLSILHYIT